MSYTTKVPHPYGVKPSGNAFLAGSSANLVRSRGLGDLRRVRDEAMLDTLSYLTADELARFMVVSRMAYVLSNHTDLWRDLTLRRWNGVVRYISTWRDSFNRRRLVEKGLCAEDKFVPHKPISVQGVFSDILHRTWVCHTCDLAHSCPGFYDHEDIPRRDARELTVEQFIEEYEKPNKPVILTNVVDDWPSLKLWTADYLSKVCGDKHFRATSATAPVAASFTMAEYFKYAAEAKEEAPLYLFDRDFHTVAELAEQYEVPAYFNPKHNKGADLFRVFGEKARPDHKWLIAGPARSGSIFHIDPNQTNAWNVCVRGSKKWIFYPPCQQPPGVCSSPDGADVTVPLSTGEWLLSFWNMHREARKTTNLRAKPMECVTKEGEVIFVPNGYWHMVVNLEDCIAITQNYVSTSNLSEVLRFLREKEDQISGVRDRAGEAVQAEEMYELFVQKLKTVLTEEEVQKAVADSLVVKKSLMKRTKPSEFTQAKTKTKVRKLYGCATDAGDESNHRTNCYGGGGYGSELYHEQRVCAASDLRTSSGDTSDESDDTKKRYIDTSVEGGSGLMGSSNARSSGSEFTFSFFSS